MERHYVYLLNYPFVHNLVVLVDSLIQSIIDEEYVYWMR